MVKKEDSMAYTLTREALLLDLYSAYQLAKMRKGSRRYVKVFERDLDTNLSCLADELITRHYMPEPSNCFIIERPKKREIFAARFADRIVHHLYFNYTHELFEHTFIADTYACIKGRGTHYGIKRLKKHILSESENYTKKCWAMSLDIRGYFMNINRSKLLNIVIDSLCKMSTHKSPYGRTWEETIDVDFLEWLTAKIVMIDPTEHCKMTGNIKDWDDLDYNKSLFNSKEGCGLPIGNLTSQLFSNVYLNVFDQFMKREMKCKHYGRYVDDAFVISRDKDFLIDVSLKAKSFLKDKLGLTLHEGKLFFSDVNRGVEFLGAYILPHRDYVSNSSLKRMIWNVDNLDTKDKYNTYQSVNSYLGTLSHYNSYNIRANMFLTPRFLSVSSFNKEITKMNKVYNKQ